ncbi:fimbrial protein [Serratia quinivorans]|uniref:fimbrial protein n=1 Tax=Serratia quinivorans TaxID=137545 RepID=UPI0021799981|nr:fimbrial protein [Serratia quinivorans]CAI1072742.1 P pilus assembly protein, pilin FimA [Serratia quinivorans]
MNLFAIYHPWRALVRRCVVLFATGVCIPLAEAGVDVAMTFTGSYVNYTCKISNQTVTVDFGELNQDAFTGTQGPTKAIPVTMTCADDVTLTYSLSGTADSTNTHALKNTAANGATGLAIMVSNDAGRELWVNSSFSAKQSGLNATLVKTATTPTDGPIAATATITIGYP